MTNSRQGSYLAVPQAGKGPGVLVLHAWWGLNAVIRDLCDRLAEEGFVALAPDLYFGAIATTIAEAKQLSSDLDDAIASAEVTAALAELRGMPEVTGSGLGVVGFSLGAYYALWLAQAKPQDIHAVTVFYGTPGELDFSQSQAAFQGHFAQNDPFEPAESVADLEKLLRAANRPVSFHTYPATGHWFFEADRQDAYNAQAAQQAWERTVEFLRKNLPGA